MNTFSPHHAWSSTHFSCTTHHNNAQHKAHFFQSQLFFYNVILKTKTVHSLSYFLQQRCCQLNLNVESPGNHNIFILHPIRGSSVIVLSLYSRMWHYVNDTLKEHWKKTLNCLISSLFVPAMLLAWPLLYSVLFFDIAGYKTLFDTGFGFFAHLVLSKRISDHGIFVLFCGICQRVSKKWFSKGVIPHKSCTKIGLIFK